MALKGELLSADLSNVFQMLAMNGKRGLLTVQDRVNPVARRRFFLDGQTVLLAEPIERKPSLALLVEMGRVTYDQYSSAMQRARRFNSDPYGILKAQGTVSDADADAFQTRASNEVLLEVFLWRDIRFTLDETVVRPPDPGSTPLQIDHVIMEAARRQDEWKHVVEAVGSHREVFRRCQDGPSLGELDPVERIVLDFVNGVDATPDIMAKCGLPRYYVDLSLANLLRAGVVARLAPEELIMTGDRLVESSQVREGIRLFHCALRSDRANIAVHKRLAAAHMKTGEVARACGHLRFCSVLKLKDGERREALALLQQAWQLLPTHFSTLERILSILLDGEMLLTKDDRACVADCRRLLQVWHDTGEAERAVELATRIWAIDQSDREVLHTAARLNLRLGRVEAAATAYLTLAARLQADHDLRGALDIFRTIASLDAAHSKGCEEKIEELKAEIDQLANRKRRGKSFRVALVSMAATAVLYAGYAWFGQQVVRDLDACRSTEPSARDALTHRYEVAAFWFRLTPAGERAAECAAALLSQAALERQAQHEQNERTAARLAAQHRLADDAVSEGLRMVKSGDLALAAKRLKEGLASFPAAESPAASRAAKALADVEIYLASGRKLLADATAVESADPDAAFRLRLKALRDFELVPEVKTLKLTLRIESIPADANLLVQGSSEEYTAPIGIAVGGQGLLALEGRAEGFLPRTVSLALPPEFATWTVVLEKAPRAMLKTKEPLASAVPAGEGRMLLTARNGPVFMVDVSKPAVVAEYKPSGLDSQSRPPVISGSRALCLLDDGRARVLELPALREIRAFRLAAQAGTPPVALAGGWVVAGPDTIEIIDRDGTTQNSFALPGGVLVRDLAVLGGVIYCAAGEVGLLAIDPKSADVVRVVSTKFTAAVAPGPNGSLLVHRPQVGIVRLHPTKSEEAVMLPHPGDGARIRRVRDDRWAVLFDGEIAFVTAQGLAGRARIPGARADGTLVIDSASGAVGAIVDGWCSVFESSSGRCVAGYACEPAMSPAFLRGQFVNVHADGRVTMTDAP